MDIEVNINDFIGGKMNINKNIEHFKRIQDFVKTYVDIGVLKTTDTILDLQGFVNDALKDLNSRNTFDIGNKVKIISDLDIDKVYGDETNVVDEMLKFSGKEVTITDVCSLTRNEYKIKEDDGRWIWSGFMFEK